MKTCVALVAFLVLSGSSCNHSTETSIADSAKSGTETNGIPVRFSEFWYGGKAEVSGYHLTQARYGELRAGEAVLIFVTEDFSKSKQVKLDDPKKAGDDAIRVLKMNMVKKFNTGIYPYAMMLSVFSPVAGGHPLKTTASVQEWCGQTFTQFNLYNNLYAVRQHSYFESEGETDTTLNLVWLEDEFWMQIRLDPTLLPQGEIEVIPGSLSQRLLHSAIQSVSAHASIRDADSAEAVPFGGSALRIFTVTYPSEQRTLTIYFLAQFPYTIEGWEETYPDGFGQNKKMLTTRAVRNKTLIIDYWNHNALADSVFRDSLQLMP